MSAFTFPFKLYDTANIASRGRIDKHWSQDLFNNVFEGQRKGPMLPFGFKKFDPDWLIKHFNLRGFEFGNWLSQEDRWLYLVGCSVSLYDLARITGVHSDQMGFAGLLSAAFGARGSSSALAHFEPHTMAINLTRYDRATKQAGDVRFLLDGGVGSLGHEWAHALDFFLGNFAMPDPNLNWGTCALKSRVRHISHGRYKIEAAPRDAVGSAFYDVMKGIMFKEQDGAFVRSSFYDRVWKLVNESKEYGPYWIDIKELLARSFEVFLTYEGETKGIHNPYLFKNKYVSPVYPTKEEYNTWANDMRKLLKLAKREIPRTGQPFAEYLNR